MNAPASTKVIGLMSGTSLDGVDAVVVDFSSEPPKTLATFWLPYPAELRQQALNLQAPRANELHLAALLGNALSRCYAAAVDGVLKLAGLTPGEITAIGCHGQTVRHQPAAGYTVQLGNPSLLAELTGIRVVADFRSRDIAAGGQGAPLVPAYHEAVFRDEAEHRVILNLGGIANLTDLPSRLSGQPVRGFDSGPGNLLMDDWIERHGGKHYDENGAWARQGKVLPDLLEVMQHDPFFALPPPKSCGRDGFNTRWLDARLIGGEAPEDVQATLAELTAVTVAQAVERFCDGATAVFACGGGASNDFLMERLRHTLPQHRVENTSALGQPSDWVEAVAFAWLAWRTLNGETGNLPDVTGARGARVLGAIYPA
jgi:anhydro-N-acetylmuramic acid kinase